MGFGRDGHPTIDDLFNPYYYKNPFTGEVTFEKTDVLIRATQQLYWQEGDVLTLAWKNTDNPLEDYEEDPLTQLTGEEREHMWSILLSSYNKPQFFLFLRRLKSNTDLGWNYDPAWLEAKMQLFPDMLLEAQLEFLHTYASGPEDFEYIESLEHGTGAIE